MIGRIAWISGDIFLPDKSSLVDHIVCNDYSTAKVKNRISYLIIADKKLEFTVGFWVEGVVDSVLGPGLGCVVSSRAVL